MQAIRNIYAVKNNQVIIDLPESFDYTSVEVIILPAYNGNLLNRNDIEINQNKNERLKKLLSISVWDEEDFKIIKESQNLINKWKIEEF
jgi:hypothetical protein